MLLPLPVWVTATITISIRSFPAGQRFGPTDRSRCARSCTLDWWSPPKRRTHRATATFPVVVVVAVICPPTTRTENVLADGELIVARPCDRSIVKTALTPSGVVTVTSRELPTTPAGREPGYSSRVSPAR